MTWSRRMLLAAGGAAMASLAGCSAFGFDFGDETPAYDTERLAALGTTALPKPPSTFPVDVPDETYTRHLERARQLVEDVPETPDVPNGAVVRRLQRDRQEVIEALDEHPDRDEADQGPFDRLGDARGTRAAAAAVVAAYRAATDDITADSVAARYAELRSDRVAFVRGWQYRGGHPATALVFHRHLEDLQRDVRRSLWPEQAFPDDPTTAVFRVGEIVGQLENGRAALSDAERLRARYLDDVTSPRSFSTAMSVATARLRRRIRADWSPLHEYVDPDAQLPFERSIENTALEELYREAAASVRRHEDDGRRVQRRGVLATALREASLELTARRTLAAIVTAIRNGEIESPTRVEEFAAARQQAVAALHTAWTTTPAVLSVDLSRPAYYRLQRGRRDLDGNREDAPPPDSRDARRAFANFAYARQYATTVPQTIVTLREVFLAEPPVT